MANKNPNVPYRMGTYHMVNSAEYEPQRVNNFEVQIVGLGTIKVPTLNKGDGNSGSTGTKEVKLANAGFILTLSTKTYAAPQINMSTINISYGNNKVKYAGLPEFPDSTIVFNDYIGRDVEKILTTWQQSVYNPETQQIGLAKNYKKKAYLHEYAPDGAHRHSWELDGVWLSQLQLGDFNQEGNAVREVTGTLTYDRAVRLS